MAFSSFWNIRGDIILIKLTELERRVLIISTFLVICATIIYFIPNFAEIKYLVMGMTLFGVMTIIGYSFIIIPMKGQSTRSYQARLTRGGITSFPYDITPPSPISKKTKLKGSCDQCNEPVLMGFTCSYCNGYFCSAHRLPEKHDCPRFR